MKIKHHLIERTPFGVQETFITDAGHLELWGDDKDGYQWRFTSLYQSTSSSVTYPNRPDAFEAAARFVNEG